MIKTSEGNSGKTKRKSPLIRRQRACPTGIANPVSGRGRRKLRTPSFYPTSKTKYTGTFRATAFFKAPGGDLQPSTTANLVGEAMLDRNSCRPRDEAAGEVLALLCSTYPKCFFMYERRRKPLKIGIRDDIKGIEEEILRRALKIYVLNGWYRKGLKVGAKRIDLNGNPAGVVAEKEVNKKKAKPAPPPPPKRDGLAALKEAARRRKAEAERRVG